MRPVRRRRQVAPVLRRHRGQRAAGAVNAQAVLFGRRDHLGGELAGGTGARGAHVLRHGAVVDEHKVVFKGRDLARVVHGHVAVGRRVHAHHHAARVLVHASEGGPAQHLITRMKLVDPEVRPAVRWRAARPGARGEDLLDGVHRARRALRLIPGVEAPFEPGGAIGQEPAHLGHLLEEGRQRVSQRRQVQVLAGAQAVHDAQIGGERHAAVDHVLLEDALEAARDDELHAAALVRDHGDLAAGAGPVGVAAYDDLEASAPDLALLHHLFEIFKKIRSQDVGRVAERARGAGDHRVRVHAERERLAGPRRVLAVQLGPDAGRVIEQSEHAPRELHGTSQGLL